MTGKLAWLAMFDSVDALFKLEGTPATNMFGWRIPAQHPLDNRIAWVPGDPSGALGTLQPVRNPGTYPRSLGTLGEVFTILINGQDLTEPENERLQYQVCRYLRDAWFRAAYIFAHGAFTVRSEQWVTQRLERRHGAALKLVVELEATIPDEPWPNPGNGEGGLAPADTGILIDVTELDVTETIQVEPTDTP